MRLETSTARHRLRIAPETERNGNERSILTKGDWSRFQRAEPFRLIFCRTCAGESQMPSGKTVMFIARVGERR